MAKEICISSTPHETRLAILEDDQLAEIYYERENEYTLAGSIYNGRVTRVLPGMQSAFVDVGLERDAFLYVTDFLELEDPEETEELEKAAASGGNQPPREVKHGGAPDNRGGRQGQKPEQRPEQKQDRPTPAKPFTEKPPKGRVLIESDPEPNEAVAAESAVAPELPFDGAEDPGAAGAKRWRGRRRRRGGRGGAGSPEGQPQNGEAPEVFVEEIAETVIEVAPQVEAADFQGDRSSSSRREAAEAAPRFERAPAAAPTPFVMPGESLSKYGGASAETSSEENAASVPVRPANSFKPATLIQSPIEWDGSGLLPGETLSKHRTRQNEPAEVEPEVAPYEAPVAGSPAPDAVEEQEFYEETTEESPSVPALVAPIESSYGTTEEELLPDAAEGDFVEGDLFEEELTPEAAAEPDPAKPEPKVATPVEPEDYAIEPVIEQPSVEDTVAAPMTRQDEVLPEGAHDEPADRETSKPEPDATAAHNVDPVPPAGFRLFGIGKKKDEEKAVKPETAPATTGPASSYAPGSGLIEEETIEEEEFDAPRHTHRAKGGDHESDDFEEETLPTHMRTGDLGEMLQEAHLDHRIQLNFDEKNGDEEEIEDDEEPSAEGQPAGTATQPRRDRFARGRRGRGGPAAPAAPAGRGGRGPSRRSMQLSDLPVISDLLKPGQEILVQIAKEPIAKKGARITSHIALPGRFLVFMPTVSHIGVSRKIASDEERQRLKRILVHERGEASGGFIVRTAAEGASEDELRTDLRMLLNLWAEIKQRSEASKSPALIFHDSGLIERILRDQVNNNFSAIWVDSEENYERIVRLLNLYSPALTRRVKLYTKETPLFEQFGIQDEIAKALRSKVWLKSGGSIVINQTEALVAIDINTGKYVGKSARLEDTIVKTNLDAVPEIVRQIRLRDLGGIIVIDFIDMDDRKNRYKVMAALEEALKSDRAPTKVLQFNDFGLVAITRKRVKQSLERTLSVPCPTCQATGMVKSPTTVCNEIYTELRKMKKHFEGADVLLRVNPETVKVLKANNGSWLTEFEELVSKNILVKSDATLHPEQFDIQG
ncbi:MAG: Rne/Rng family ribonuclease [Terracidiphilus sp.]|jgi:ribonuclease G